MRIISGFRHPSRPDWNKALDNLAFSAITAGHHIDTSPLPTGDRWIASHNDLFLSLCWKYKVVYIQERLANTKEHLIWVDGDCIINKKLDIDEALGDCDVGFTLRDIKDRQTTSDPVRDGYINSGVIFIRNNHASRSFFSDCRNHLLTSLYDQEAFNIELLKHSAMESHGQKFKSSSAMIKMLDCREYNNFYFDDTTASAKITHFKSKIGRDKYKEIYGVSI
jgi:hypothetical protein